MIKIDASQPLSMADGNNAFSIEQDQTENQGYCKDFWQSFKLIYFKQKWFDDKCKYRFIIVAILYFDYLDWKLAFCSSSFDLINKYPNLFLIYRTLLFVITIIDLIHGITITRPVYEWGIYYTHLTLLMIFFAILFQFIITYRVNFYRGNDIVPRHCLQYIHIILILISLGSGLAVCLLYWTVIYRPSTRLYYPRLILDHGILWLLLFIDIFVFTRLPIYMIDCIPLMIFAIIYGIFTLIVFLSKTKFSHERMGYVYRAFNFNNSPIRVIIQMVLFVFFVPLGSMLILWNLFRLRRPIHVKIAKKKEELDLNVMT